MESLKGYKRPRDKVTSLLRKGKIIRIKKGLYLANTDEYPGISVREVVANILYGPSYISLQYALYLYGLIPEYVEQITSVTFKKSKKYHTPIGDFIYRSVPHDYYLPGVVLHPNGKGISYLIASQEKALMDMVYFTHKLKSVRDVRDFIIEDLRIDRDIVLGLDLDEISLIAATSGSGKLFLCRKAVEAISNEAGN
jgi:hypothetical protein